MLSRSLLFVPADKEKMLLKVNSLKADIILLDLEDAVALADKQYARDLLIKHLPSMKKQLFIRINSRDSNDYQKDIALLNELVAVDSLKGIILPKSDSLDTINEVADQLQQIESHNHRNSKLLIIPLIESALGIKNADEIACSNERVKRLAFGGLDYVSDIDGQNTVGEQELLFARSKIVISSRCAGIEKPIDTVYIDISNQSGFVANCDNVKSLGFAGKLLIHPAQIESANRVFSPSEKDVQEAREIMEHIEKNDNEGVFQLNGKMVDKPIIEKAKRVLNEYEKITNYMEGL